MRFCRTESSIPQLLSSSISFLGGIPLYRRQKESQNAMSAQCAMCGNRSGRRRVELPPEAVELMIGQPDFDAEEVIGPVTVHFCKDHWETVEEFVKDRGVNPLLRCLAEYVEEPAQNEEYEKKNLREKVAQSNAEVRQKYWDTLTRDREVESKLVLWTLDAVSDTVNENVRRLRYDLLEQMEGRDGNTTVRCSPSEDADLLANVRTGGKRYLFAFKVVGVSPSNREVLDVGYETSISVKLSSRITPFQSSAQKMDAVPLLAIKWADDPRFFVHDLRRESETITIQEPVSGGLLMEDIQFTPLPTIRDLPEAITEDRWEKAIERRRKEEAAKHDLVEKFFQRLR